MKPYRLLRVIALALTCAAACTPTEPVNLAIPDTELGQRLTAGAELAVEGKKLNIERLKAFYARRGFAPVWAARPGQAEALIQAVARAEEHGLAPERFHGQLLRVVSLPPLDRDLLLSDAFLSYADALARGAHPVERRRKDETLTPGPIDVAAALDAALATSDPAAAIESLAPTTPSYRLLRQALREARENEVQRRQTIMVNLERERWLPRKLPADRVWVSITDQRLTLYRGDRPALNTRIIIGRNETGNQTPELQVPIDAIWFNPPWNVPTDIAAKILPQAKADPTYLARNNMVLQPDGVLQQKAGPSSALGYLLFEMNNPFDVYLHDTPARELFQRDVRLSSHGCIRVEDPRKLASLLMELPAEEIDRRIATRDTVRTNVPKPVPVFLVYRTAFADADGKLQFRPDIYGRDAEVWRAIAPPGQQRVAQR